MLTHANQVRAHQLRIVGGAVRVRNGDEVPTRDEGSRLRCHACRLRPSPNLCVRAALATTHTCLAATPAGCVATTATTAFAAAALATTDSTTIAAATASAIAAAL